MEIYYNTQKWRKGLGKLQMLVVVSYVMFPFLVRWVANEPMFMNNYQMWLEMAMMMPKFTFFSINIMMLCNQSLIFEQKLQFKQAFMSLFTPLNALKYRFPGFLPLFKTQCPQNLECIMDLMDVLQTMDRKYLDRSQIFGASIQIIFSLQALIIYVNLMLREDIEIGEGFFTYEYVMNSIEIFTLVTIVQLIGYIHAANANLIDQDMKRQLMALNQDFNRIKIQAAQDKICLRKPEVKNQEALRVDPSPVPLPKPFVTLNNSEQETMTDKLGNGMRLLIEHSSDPNLVWKEENPSQEVQVRVEVLEETVSKKMDYMDYKLEYDQIQSFIGPAISYDLISQIIFVFVSIEFTFAQRMFSM
mmetsp:Transcript_42570/g.65282  ORF Transcript_42570/g.65282 Transcript_42570/m.65282 type:complete len:359 (-) Transcript_42570:34-1110(-)